MRVFHWNMTSPPTSPINQRQKWRAGFACEGAAAYMGLTWRDRSEFLTKKTDGLPVPGWCIQQESGLWSSGNVIDASEPVRHRALWSHHWEGSSDDTHCACGPRVTELRSVWNRNFRSG